jgi:hypothetical protein
MTYDTRRTLEIKCRIVVAKAAFNKKLFSPTNSISI